MCPTLKIAKKNSKSLHPNAEDPLSAPRFHSLHTVTLPVLTVPVRDSNPGP